ncbi:MAG: sigma factor-like helix-turn-helix DNA-binding protein, partial [Myxococcota bacterium]|nr:sigma factor-like helix-turn-helix DNA-binding protein [Myxococcota bacterium]
MREEETVALTQTADSNVPPKGEDGEAAALPPKAPAQGLREDHPVLQKIDPDKVDGLGATTLTRLGVETFYDLLSLDEHTMLNTPGVGRGKVAILRDLTTHAKALVGEDERYAQDEVARSPLDEEISARDVEGIGAATLSELGVKVWRDLLEVDTATLLEVPGVSLIKARVIIELIARARKLASAEDDDIPPTLTQRIEAQGIDPQRLAHQVLVRLSNRSSNAIESAQLTLAEVAARVESHDLKSLAGVGGKSGDELREHILTLAERGYTYYLFGEEGPPKDTPDAVERILASLKPLDRMLLRRRYRDNATLEMLAQDIDQTRERVRQRIKKVLTDAAPIYGEVFHKLLADLINEVDANQGVLNTARALELSPGDEEPWEILFALDLLGRDASVLDEHLFCTLNTDERNELANALTQTLRQVPHRRLTASIARAAIARKHSIDLDDAAVGVLLDRVLGYARVDGAHWQNIGITEGALYATAMAPYEDALTLEEIAAAYQRHNGDPAPPDARHVYNHINRTDAIYRMEEGLYIHADHLPMPAAELADVISQLVEMVRTRGEVVDVSELRAELLRDGLIDPAVTTALLHNALSRREDVKIFKGSTTEVAPAGSGLERTTLTERIEEILEELNEVSTPAALQPMLSARG